MKKFSAIVLLGLSGLAAFAEETPPPALLVTGCTSILGDRQVLFKIFPAGGGEQSGILAEGEARGGIRLLRIDLSTGVAQFDNHGLLQTISICDTPDLPIGLTNGSGSLAGERWPTTSAGMFSGSRTGGQAAAEGVSPSRPAGGLGGFSQHDGAAEAAGVEATEETADQPKVQPWWYRAAAETEAARLLTAAAVLQGENAPYPLTPLTPANTDPRLISTNAVYFNHFDR